MTRYMVLEEKGLADDDDRSPYMICGSVTAANAEKACRIVADDMSDADLANGITLIAVPARNWTSGRNTFKSETRRRLLKA
jgi:hypothetical protein